MGFLGGRTLVASCFCHTSIIYDLPYCLDKSCPAMYADDTNLKPVTDEQGFYDKFLCDKFYLLVCTRNFDNFFYDKCTCSRASMLAFEQVHLS
jgi:hypothetical protein